MTKRARPFLLALATLMPVVTAGCGTSGSNPILYHEVHFQVAPASTGQATFSVMALDADGVPFGFPDGTTFTATGTFSFYLEGAAPPYSGTFVQVGPDPITVSIYIDRSPVSTDNISQGDGTSLTVGPVALGTPGSPPPQGQLVRFDVCAPPVPGSYSCATTNAPGFPAVPAGVFGIPYTGSIGDQYMSHLLEDTPSDTNPPRTAPAIYFLQNARDSANGIFGSVSGQWLQAQLFVDNELRQTATGNGTGTGSNIRLRTDL